MQQEEKEKQSMLQKAINIATHEFRDKVDKQGMPYILHLFRVMFKVAKHGQEFMQIALLHDLLEDCPDWTMDRLISEGFSPIVVVTISRLTHVGGIDYQKYIESIYENPVATIVKGADLEDNMDILRLSALQEKDVPRLNKYLKAYNYLKKANY